MYFLSWDIIKFKVSISDTTDDMAITNLTLLQFSHMLILILISSRKTTYSGYLYYLYNITMSNIDFLMHKTKFLSKLKNLLIKINRRTIFIHSLNHQQKRYRINWNLIVILFIFLIIFIIVNTVERLEDIFANLY
jgi:hypothetical protein